MKATPFILTFLLATGAASAGFAQASGEVPSPQTPPQMSPVDGPETPEQPSIEERLTFLLSGYEYFPTREDLDAVAAAEVVSAQLRAFVTNTDLRPTHRIRSVDALGYYDDDATIELLMDLARSEPKDGASRRELRTSNLLKHHAITAIARSKEHESTEVLTPLLEHADVQIVLTTVHALGKHGGDSGRAALRKLRDETTKGLIRREAAKWVR